MNTLTMPSSCFYTDRLSSSDMSAPSKKSFTPSQYTRGLSKLGLITEMDWVLHIPHRYIDESTLISIRQASITHGQAVQVEGQVTSAEVQYKPRKQLVVTIADHTNQLVLRFLNFYGSQVNQFTLHTRIRARGEVRLGFFGAEMIHPDYQIVQPDAPLPTHFTPIYPSTIGVSQNKLRRAIYLALEQSDLKDTLPLSIRQTLYLPEFSTALRLLHQPPLDTDITALEDRSHEAYQRIKFDELLAQQLSLQRAYQLRQQYHAPALTEAGEYTHALLMSLPFTLTHAQQRVLEEIRQDLMSTHPMQRLLQGDVGCGKTIVAALCATQAMDNQYQTVLMAPTEVLATQHFHKIASWLAPIGVQVVWITGHVKKKEKAALYETIESGQAQLIIGTHALLQDQVKFARLGLIIIDEQHRFGVNQRLTLRNKGQTEASPGFTPHQLMMSATPIPRTLAMTYYANLDISIIDELPPNRAPIITRIIDQERRHEVIEKIALAAQKGRQIYWICPLIEESEALHLQTVLDTYTMLTTDLPTVKIGFIHGRMKTEDKQAVMALFATNQLQLLIATTVIEVGVDVPNASLMVIEHAERFGLSQLHQLRGRVGRGSTASVCLLLYQTPLSRMAKERLITMRNSVDGFEIAHKDLMLRGPGEFLGAKQAGLATLRFADLETDQHLVGQARELAQQLLQRANQHDMEALSIIEAHLMRWMYQKEDYLKV